ncbi:MAG: hypothetical protein HY905_04775 [Deltaproteobacteria bacterium]|nr:hypothetical protein [Deltaproteobacteria bacterium]
MAILFSGCDGTSPPARDASDDADEMSADSGRCTGPPAACDSFHDIMGCELQGGCGYNYHDLVCVETRPVGATPCTGLLELECHRQVGCRWE